MTTEQKLKKFIIDNNLKFTEGRRNSDSVILSGYALHLGVDNSNNLCDIIDEATKNTADPNYSDELHRVFDYAWSYNYGEWWKTKEAKKTYKF